MRIIAFVLLVALSFNGQAQKKGEITWPSFNIDGSTNLISYTDVPEVAGASSGELYDRAMGWIKGYYKNYAEKLRKYDRESGEIEVFGRFPIYAYDKKGVKTTSSQGLVQYTLTIRFRDGRYKYEITKLNHKSVSYQPLEKWLDREDTNAENHAYYLADVDAELKSLIESMTNAIASSGEQKKDDW
jgi:hypothetical protein